MRLRSTLPPLLALLALGLLAGTAWLLDAYDLPSKLRDRLRPWVIAAFDIEPEVHDAAPAPPRPRWKRDVESRPTARPQAGLEITRSADSEATVSTRLVRLDGITRRAVEGGVPHRFELQVEAPPEAELWLSLNQTLSPLAADGIRYRVRGRVDGREREILDERVPARALGWRDRQLDLSALGPGPVALSFEATPLGAREARVEGSAFWGDLQLRSRRTPTGPDLAVILIDTLRADHLGAYGYTRPTSPYIDQLAQEGARFSRAIASAPWTDPAILSIMTGLYPDDVWEPAPHRETASWVLPTSLRTLAGELSRAGYFTVAASDHPSVAAHRFGGGFDVFAELYHQEVAFSPSHWRKTDQRKLLARTERLLGERSAGPGFFYLHLLYPHRPLDPPPGYLEAVGAPASSALSANGGAMETSGEIQDLDAELDRYDAEIRVADDVVRRFHRMLIQSGWDEDLILVVLSDHGEGFAAHGFQEHGNTLYNELLHVPLIVHAPGRIAPGVVVDDLVRQVDVLPTLLELAGAPAVPGIRGASMLPLLDGGGPGRIAYSAFPHSRIVDGYAVQSAAMKKVVGDPRLSERPWFDLRRDGDEQQPLASAPGPAGAELLADAERVRRDAELSPVPTGDAAEPTGDTIEMLETLGYVE